jgi:hypothetical protein
VGTRRVNERVDRFLDVRRKLGPNLGQPGYRWGKRMELGVSRCRAKKSSAI